MNTLNRCISIYSPHHILLRLCSPSTKIMAPPLNHRRAFCSGDGRSPIPKKRTTTSSESFSSKGNDYEEQFPPLNGSKNKSGKSSRPSDTTNLFTPDKSPKSQISTSHKDALSLQRNEGCKNTDQGPRRRLVLPSETYAPVVKRNDISIQFTEKEANGTNLSTRSQCSQSQNWKICKDGSSSKRNQGYPGRNNRDQRQELPFGIFSSVGKRNDRCITDEFVEEDANGTNPATPSQRSQSQIWTIRKDGSSLKRNQGYLGLKNQDQSPKGRKKSPFDICSSVRKRNDRCITDEFVEEEANGEETGETVEVSNKHRVLRPGMVLLKHYLTHDVQVDIVKTCRGLGVKSQGFYQPGYKAGSKLRLQMMCLGRNWDPQTKYGKNTEIDSEPANIPETFSVLVEQAIREAHPLIDRESGTKDAESEIPMMSPDICIVNFYSETGRLGLHQDRDESRESIRKGLPIVSFSIGDTAEFLYGEERDVEKAEQVELESGDVLIFGGESRMIFHGVKSIIPNSAPMSLLNDSNLRTGRLNLTFRHF